MISFVPPQGIKARAKRAAYRHVKAVRYREKQGISVRITLLCNISTKIYVIITIRLSDSANRIKWIGEKAFLFFFLVVATITADAVSYRVGSGRMISGSLFGGHNGWNWILNPLCRLLVWEIGIFKASI